jgi:hypothetical protein
MDAINYNVSPHASGTYRNFHVDITSDIDVVGTSKMTLDTSKLPQTLTAYELALILNMTITAQECLVDRWFPDVKKYFTADAAS